MNVVFDEYQDNSKLWHVGFFKAFPAEVDNFVLPARVMGMSLDKYYKWVIDNFEPIIQIYKPETGFVMFAWKNYSKAHSLLLTLNRNARKNNLTI